MEERIYATGRRKTSSARVWLMPGTGRITVNHRPAEEYADWHTWYLELREPFEVTDTWGQYDVWATVRGGGIHSQIQAVRHGIARALVQAHPEFRKVLREAGLLTRDPRMKERKHYGHKRARRGFQFSKR
jgi:small subunit ribosomal protein S9